MMIGSVTGSGRGLQMEICKGFNIPKSKLYNTERDSTFSWMYNTYIFYPLL